MREYKVTMHYLGGETRVAYITASSGAHSMEVAKRLYAPRNIVAMDSVER